MAATAKSVSGTVSMTRDRGLLTRVDFLPPSYLAHRDDIKSGDLIEWQSKTALGWTIRKFTGREVNHTSLLVRPGQFSTLRDRRFLLEALEGGITPTLLTERLRHFKGTVWWLPLVPRYDRMRQTIAEFAIDVMCRDRPAYDYPSLFGQIFGRVSLDAQRYFCSEWCQFIWCCTGVLRYLPAAVRPGEFESFGVTLPKVKIYET